MPRSVRAPDSAIRGEERGRSGLPSVSKPVLPLKPPADKKALSNCLGPDDLWAKRAIGERSPGHETQSPPIIDFLAGAAQAAGTIAGMCRLKESTARPLCSGPAYLPGTETRTGRLVRARPCGMRSVPLAY